MERNEVRVGDQRGGKGEMLTDGVEDDACFGDKDADLGVDQAAGVVVVEGSGQRLVLDLFFAVALGAAHLGLVVGTR